MDYLLVIDNATGDAQQMTLAGAADRTCIAAAIIEHLLEQAGVCNSLDFSIIDLRRADDIMAA